MKLIDILVQELPKLGGWPDGIDDIEMLSDGTIYFNGDIAPDNYKLTQCSDGWSRLKSAKDYSNAVTREQYEAALAASKPEWNGEGLPPVGAEVECICNEFPNDGQEKLLGHILYSGEYTILKTYKTYNQHHAPVERVFKTKSWAIIPIRSEADKKRAEAVIALSRIDPQAMPFEYGDKHSDGSLIGPFWYELYDAIAAGKIPHIRID